MTLNYFNLLAYSLWKYITPFSILRPRKTLTGSRWRDSELITMLTLLNITNLGCNV